MFYVLFIVNKRRIKLKISELINHGLPLGMRKNKPILILGKSGIGKSDAVRCFAKNQGRDVIDLRLTLYDAVDLGGIPYVDPDSKELIRKVMKLLPTERSRPSVLFLDEINLALPSTQAAAYQLVLNHCLGEWKCPDNCYVVAAGNLTTDKGNTHTIAAPLRNRFTIIKMESDLEDWTTWALQNKVHPDIVAFVRFSPRSLSSFDNNVDDNSNFSTGRSLVTYGEYLYDIGEGCPEEVVYEMGEGLIGSGLNIAFKAFRKTALKLPNPQDILTGKVTKLDSSLKNEMSCAWKLSIEMIYLIKDTLMKGEKSKVTPYLENAIGFFENNMETSEFSILTLTNYMQVFIGTEFDNQAPEFVQNSKKLEPYLNKINKYIK